MPAAAEHNACVGTLTNNIFYLDNTAGAPFVQGTTNLLHGILSETLIWSHSTGVGMYYSYFTRNGIEYASATSSVRKGGRVTKGDQVYLGRVVDKERHIFRNRERGLFSYDIETGEFLDPPRDFDEPPVRRKNARPRPKVLSVSFGDV